MENLKEEYIRDIKITIQQIQDWIEPNSCRCSYYPTRNLVLAAINWEIWEEFRLIKYFNEEIIENLANIMLWEKKL